MPDPFINVMDSIPSGLWAGIEAGTDTTDLASYLASARAAALGRTHPRRLVFPSGVYHYSALPNFAVSDSEIIGEGSSPVFWSKWRLEQVTTYVWDATVGDYRAVDTYRYLPGPRLSCPVFALRGEDDPKVDHDEARAWGDHTTGGFELRTFAGDHFYLAEHAAEVIALIVDRMSAALNTSRAAR